MSQLTPLVAKLKQSGAERVFFSPNEHGVVVDGDAKRPLPGGPVQGATILEAVSELLSQDDIDALSNRPRVIRYEHDGEELVFEIVRQTSGIALGIRQGTRAPRSVRDVTHARPEPRVEISDRALALAAAQAATEPAAVRPAAIRPAGSAQNAS